MMRLIPVRVLIIDDDDSVCRKVSGWLTEADYDVTTFTDHAAALEHAQHVFSQVALVDLQFPDADVAELLDALRRISPLTRVVAMAAFPDVPLVVAAIRAGAQDVLEKPIQPPSLLAALERQLEQAGVSVRSEAEYNRRLLSLIHI